MSDTALFVHVARGLYSFIAVRKTSYNPAFLILRRCRERISEEERREEKREEDEQLADLVQAFHLLDTDLLLRARRQDRSKKGAIPHHPCEGFGGRNVGRRSDELTGLLASNLQSFPLPLLDPVDKVVDILSCALDKEDTRVPAQERDVNVRDRKRLGRNAPRF